jgi:hypothetical protein
MKLATWFKRVQRTCASDVGNGSISTDVLVGSRCISASFVAVFIGGIIIIIIVFTPYCKVSSPSRE